MYQSSLIRQLQYILLKMFKIFSIGCNKPFYCYSTKCYFYFRTVYPLKRVEGWVSYAYIDQHLLDCLSNFLLICYIASVIGFHKSETLLYSSYEPFIQVRNSFIGGFIQVKNTCLFIQVRNLFIGGFIQVRNTCLFIEVRTSLLVVSFK